MRRLIGAPRIARKDDIVPNESISLTLKIIFWRVQICISCVLKPFSEFFGLTLAVGMPEMWQHYFIVVDKAAVGREHEIREALHGLKELHIPAQLRINPAKAVPLLSGLARDDWIIFVHPRIDLILDIKKIRRAHQHVHKALVYPVR